MRLCYGCCSHTYFPFRVSVSSAGSKTTIIFNETHPCNSLWRRWISALACFARTPSQAVHSVGRWAELAAKSLSPGAALPGVTEVLTVTNRELFFKTQDEFREVNKAQLATSFILEPFGRNTAAAIAAAALHAVQAHGDDALC